MDKNIITLVKRLKELGLEWKLTRKRDGYCLKHKDELRFADEMGSVCGVNGYPSAQCQSHWLTIPTLEDVIEEFERRKSFLRLNRSFYTSLYSGGVYHPEIGIIDRQADTPLEACLSALIEVLEKGEEIKGQE